MFSAHFLIELFMFLMLICMSSLHIFDTNPLSDLLFVNIFYLVDCLFILSMGSFAVKKIFSLM